MRRINGVTRAFAAVLVVTVVCAAAASASSVRGARQALAVVVRHGGLCYPGRECRSVLRITDSTVSGDGYRSRPLSPGARRALLRAVGELRVAYLRSHPFTGMCPTATDGQESIYRFRGFGPSIPSCTYDVRGLRAVRLTDRLLATLEPR